MKKIFWIVSAMMIATTALMAENTPVEKDKPAQNETAAQVVLKGNVVDSQTQESLAGVALEIEGTKLVVYTDFDGNFLIENLEPGYYTIVVRFVSYKPHLLEKVYLQPGTNNLQSIKLMAN